MFKIPVIDLKATGENIYQLRKAAGFSVKELQEIFGFGTPQAIYKWQHGTALPSVDNLVFLSAILGVPIEEILVLELQKDMQEEIRSQHENCWTYFMKTG